MSEVSIRPAVASDATEITRIFLSSFRQFVQGVTLAHSDEQVSEWIPNGLLKTQDVRVAVRDGAVVGMMALTTHDGMGWINQLYLDPRVVGQGIGKQFVELAKATLGAPIRLYTFQVNAKARRFYMRNGFHEIAYGDGSENDEKSPDVLLEWGGESMSIGDTETRQA